MAIHLGGKRRSESKKARRAGYLVEVEQVWAHVCEPPMSDHRRSVLRDSPILSDGKSAEVGTLWRCPCGRVHEVIVPDPNHPGIRVWRVVSDDAVTQQAEVEPDSALGAK